MYQTHHCYSEERKDQLLDKYENLINSFAILISEKAITLKEIDEYIYRFFQYVENGKPWDKYEKKLDDLTDKYTY